MNNFFDELKRRNVIKATIAYLVVSWVIIQVALAVLPTFGAAAWVLQAIIITLAVGLPVWITVSWIYDITPQGIAKTPKDSEKQIYKELINKRTNAFIIVSLSIAIVVMSLKMSKVFDTGTEGEYSIAVLPFVNMSDDVEQEYFSDGISEEIINMLAQVPKLKVIGRTSSFAFKGKNMDLKLIGEQLNVGYLLEGSVRKSGNKLRITAQLINVADGTHMYSEKFDRELEDIFDIQDAISGEILNAIKIKLFGSDKENFLKKYTNNLVAYELYLKGKFYYNKYTKEGFLKAIDYFNQAIALDNNYAIAYAEKGFSYLTLGYWNWLPYDQSIPQGRKAIEKSIQIDDKIAESHLNVGRVMLHTDWNIRGAIIEFKKAQKINPNNPEVYVQLGMAAILSGNHDEALVYANKAISLDPFSVFNLFMAAAATNNGERTLEICSKLIEIAPTFYGGYWLAGSSYMALEKHEEGLKAYETAVSLGDQPNAMAELGMIYGMMGEINKAMELLERIKNIEGIELYGNFFIGQVYLGMGDLDTAFNYFDKAIEKKEGFMLWSPIIFNRIPGLMEDPRAIQMIENMGVIY